MKPIFDPDELTLMNQDESDFFNEYVKKCKNYITTGNDESLMKTATAQAGAIAKIVQSRVAVAALKMNMHQSKDSTLVTKMTQQQITPSPVVPPEKKPVPVTPPDVEDPLLEKVTETKTTLFIKFSKVNECRLSKEMSDYAKVYKYVEVRKTPGQKELMVMFTDKPGSEKFVLLKLNTGVQFSARGFIKLHSLEGKTINFEWDKSTNFYYGEIL